MSRVYSDPSPSPYPVKNYRLRFTEHGKLEETGKILPPVKFGFRVRDPISGDYIYAINKRG